MLDPCAGRRAINGIAELATQYFSTGLWLQFPAACRRGVCSRPTTVALVSLRLGRRRIQLDFEKPNTLNHHRARIGTDNWGHDLAHPHWRPMMAARRLAPRQHSRLVPRRKRKIDMSGANFTLS
jgi:hypothetical protein